MMTVVSKRDTGTETAKAWRVISHAVLVAIRNSGVYQIGINPDIQIAIVNPNRTDGRCNDLHRIGGTVILAHFDAAKATIDIQILLVNLVTRGFALKLDNRTDFDAVIKSGRTFKVNFGIGL